MIIDDFTGTNGDDFSKEWWYDAAGNSGTGSTVIDDNEAQMTISSGNSGNHYKTLNRIIKGDFEIEFDFVTVTGQVVSIQQGGVYISPNKDNNTSEWGFVGLINRSGTPYAYFRYDDAGSNDSWDEVNISSKSNPYTNKFRIKRVGNQVSAYYKNEEDGSWSQIGSAHTWIEDDVYVGFMAYRNSTSATPLVYTFDNFAINSCDVIVPWNISQTGEVAAQNVWNENFVAVYHMSQDPTDGTDTILDSTVNGNHGDTHGSMTSGDLVDGVFGKAIDFDGSNDYISMPDVMDNTIGTVEVFTLIDVLGGSNNYAPIFVSDRSDFSDRLRIYNFNNGSSWDYRFGVDGNEVILTISPVNLDVFEYFAASYEVNGTFNIYKNDDTDSISAPNGTADFSPPLLAKVPDNYFSVDYLNCQIGEVRVSNIQRSSAWLKATNAVLKNILLTEGSSSSSSTSSSSSSSTTPPLYYTIDSSKIDENLIDFPVGIILPSDFTSANSYENLHVTVSGGNELYTEVDTWETSGTIWTKVPWIPANRDTVLTLEYNSNNSYIGSTGTSAAQTVWDENFVAVYHMSQNPTGGTLLDSTSNLHNGSFNGSMTSDDLIDGVFGKAIDFDGNNDIVTASVSGLTDYPATLECAGRATITAASNNNPSVGIGDVSEPDQMVLLNMYGNIGRLNFYSTGTTLLNGTVSLDAGEFAYLASALVTSTSRKLYTNGGTEQEDTGGDAWPTGIDTIGIGGTPDSTIGYRAGEVEEVRISNIARSAAWLKATNAVLKNILLTEGSSSSSSSSSG